MCFNGAADITIVARDAPWSAKRYYSNIKRTWEHLGAPDVTMVARDVPWSARRYYINTERIWALLWIYLRNPD